MKIILTTLAGIFIVGMKIISTTLAGIFIVAGFLLAGSDSGSFGAQVIVSTGGVCIMIVGGLWIISIQGGQ